MRTSCLARRVGVITLPLMVTALAACGGSTAPTAVVTVAPGATGNTLTVQEREQKLLDFAACMRKNGVTMKDPTFDATGKMTGGGFSASSGIDPRSAEFKAGMSECGTIIQGIGLSGGTSASASANGLGGNGGGMGDGHHDFDPAVMQKAMNDFTACLRSHGLPQVKDITFNGPDGDHDGGHHGDGDGDHGNGSIPPIGNTGGSIPPIGTFNGPPPGGSLPNDGGRGHGFDPTRLLEHLNLNPNDATVKTALAACQPPTP